MRRIIKHIFEQLNVFPVSSKRILDSVFTKNVAFHSKQIEFYLEKMESFSPIGGANEKNNIYFFYSKRVHIFAFLFFLFFYI